MTTALISMNGPPAVLSVFRNGSPPNPMTVPGLGQVSGAQAGWQSPGGLFRLVSVAPFVPPGGQSITGSPSYQVDAQGVVTETYATIPTPPVVLSWTPLTITRALQAIQKSKANLFFNQMADSDRAKFNQSDSIAENDALLLDALASPGVGITLAQLKAAILTLP